MESHTTISQSYRRIIFGCLSCAVAAGIATGVVMAQTGRFLNEQVERIAGNLREIVVPVVERMPDDGNTEELRRMLAMPDLTGIEVFGSQGRRIWHAGESLEIVGYRFDGQSTLSHVTADRTRYEVFWSAQALQAGHGVALRLDTRWEDRIRRDVLGPTLLISFGLLGTGIAISRWLFERRSANTIPVSPAPGADHPTRPGRVGTELDR